MFLSDRKKLNNFFFPIRQELRKTEMLDSNKESLRASRVLILQKKTATWAFVKWLILLTFPFTLKFHRLFLSRRATSRFHLFWKNKILACCFHPVFHSHLPSCLILKKPTSSIFESAILQLGFYMERIWISYLWNAGHDI